MCVCVFVYVCVHVCLCVCVCVHAGRYCEAHQMTGNYMWDKASQKEFLIGTNPDSRLPLWWNGSEPLWVTMEKLRKTAYMYFWPGRSTR